MTISAVRICGNTLQLGATFNLLTCQDSSSKEGYDDLTKPDGGLSRGLFLPTSPHAGAKLNQMKVWGTMLNEGMEPPGRVSSATHDGERASSKLRRWCRLNTPRVNAVTNTQYVDHVIYYQDVFISNLVKKNIPTHTINDLLTILSRCNFVGHRGNV